ncbi:MAG: glycosyltransferase family 39 protein [Methylococcaceae bacterium]
MVKPKELVHSKAVLCLLFLVITLVAAAKLIKKGKDFGFQIMEAGNDWVVYETYAREILFGDLLSRIESPFISMNFGYRYLLALVHQLTGEDPASVMLFQQSLMGLLVCFLTALILKRYGTKTALLFVVLSLFANQLKSVSFPLLDTTWSIVFSSLCLVSLLLYVRKPSFFWSFVAAATLGVSVLLRANFVPFIPLAALWMLCSNRKKNLSVSLAHALFFIVVTISIFSLLGWRNYVVGGEWRWFLDTGLFNLWIGNLPPEFNGPTYFEPAWTPSHPEIGSHVFNYILQDPMAWVLRTIEKALYILGIDIRTNIDIKSNIMVPWLIATFGFVKLYKSNIVSRIDIVLLVTWILVVNLPLIIIFPWGYGHRLSAPSFPALYLICAFILSQYSWSKVKFRT